MSAIYYKQESFEVIGAAMKVYNTLGPGFLEPVYQEAMEIELKKRNIPFEQQKELNVVYDGIVLKHTYKPDFVCYDNIIVEIKAVSILDDSHRSQVFNYLHVTGYKLGILINFGNTSKLEYERKVI